MLHHRFYSEGYQGGFYDFGADSIAIDYGDFSFEIHGGSVVWLFQIVPQK